MARVLAIESSCDETACAVVEDQRVLISVDGNISAAARVLNMHRRTLQRKLNKFPPRS